MVLKTEKQLLFLLHVLVGFPIFWFSGRCWKLVHPWGGAQHLSSGFAMNVFHSLSGGAP